MNLQRKIFVVMCLRASRLCALFVSRVNTETLWPLLTNSLTSFSPTNPVAPVIRAFINFFLSRLNFVVYLKSTVILLVIDYRFFTKVYLKCSFCKPFSSRLFRRLWGRFHFAIENTFMRNTHGICVSHFFRGQCLK